MIFVFIKKPIKAVAEIMEDKEYDDVKKETIVIGNVRNSDVM